MPRTLENYKRKLGKGRTERYPYDDWIALARDGPLLLVRGDDYTCDDRTMSNQLRLRLKLRDVEGVSIHQHDEGVVLLIKT